MSLTEEVEVLRNIPLFAKVEPAKLKLMAFTSERLEYLSGDELFHEGGTIAALAELIVAGSRPREHARSDVVQKMIE